jgi:hypothetical protein
MVTCWRNARRHQLLQLTSYLASLNADSAWLLLLCRLPAGGMHAGMLAWAEVSEGDPGANGRSAARRQGPRRDNRSDGVEDGVSRGPRLLAESLSLPLSHLCRNNSQNRSHVNLCHALTHELIQPPQPSCTCCCTLMFTLAHSLTTRQPLPCRTA